MKRKGTGAAGRKQSKKAAKVPNKRKRPPSVFFIFMYRFLFAFDTEFVFISFRFFCVLAIEVFVIVWFRSEFREQFKKEHPNLLMISTFL